MKKLLLSLLALVIYNFSKAQNSYHYVVDSIPHQTFQEQDIVQFNFDDFHSDVISLPFSFDFYETFSISEVLVGSNGTITFDISLANGSQQWSIPSTVAIPNTDLPIPAILGPFHDVDNSQSVEGGIFTGITGVAPNRRFHVTFEDVPGFGVCNVAISTFQMVLHETSGIIDVVVTDKPSCTGWNNGNAVLGLQALVNSQAVGIAAPGRNTGAWEAVEESWRFTPTNFLNGFNVVLCDTGNDGSELFDIDDYKLELLRLFNLNGSANTVTITNSSGLEVSSDVTIVAGTNQIENTYTIDFNLGEQTFDLTLSIINCEDDGDTDGLSNADEDLNENGNLNDDDTDGDGIPNYLDDDDDGDNVLTNIELVFNNRNSDGSASFLDTDSDLIPNHLDFDDDGDGVFTLDEDYNGNGDPTDDDLNTNGVPDYLDIEILNIDDLSLNSTLISLYPVPSKQYIKVRFAGNGFEGNQAQFARIYDIHGRLIMESSFTVQDNEITLDISSFESGNYVIVFQRNGFTRAKKFIKQ